MCTQPQPPLTKCASPACFCGCPAQPPATSLARNIPLARVGQGSSRRRNASGDPAPAVREAARAAGFCLLSHHGGRSVRRECPAAAAADCAREAEGGSEGVQPQRTCHAARMRHERVPVAFWGPGLWLLPRRRHSLSTRRPMGPGPCEGGPLRLGAVRPCEPAAGRPCSAVGVGAPHDLGRTPWYTCVRMAQQLWRAGGGCRQRSRRLTPQPLAPSPTGRRPAPQPGRLQHLDRGGVPRVCLETPAPQAPRVKLLIDGQFVDSLSESTVDIVNPVIRAGPGAGRGPTPPWLWHQDASHAASSMLMFSDGVPRPTGITCMLRPCGGCRGAARGRSTVVSIVARRETAPCTMPASWALRGMHACMGIAASGLCVTCKAIRVVACMHLFHATTRPTLRRAPSSRQANQESCRGCR